MIIQIEQARTNPSVGTTVKLADALGISITTLLDYEQGSHVRLVPESQAVRMWSTEGAVPPPCSSVRRPGARSNSGPGV